MIWGSASPNMVSPQTGIINSYFSFSKIRMNWRDAYDASGTLIVVKNSLHAINNSSKAVCVCRLEYLTSIKC